MLQYCGETCLQTADRHNKTKKDVVAVKNYLVESDSKTYYYYNRSALPNALLIINDFHEPSNHACISWINGL